jgi:glycosyltransferase XagB
MESYKINSQTVSYSIGTQTVSPGPTAHKANGDTFFYDERTFTHYSNLAARDIAFTNLVRGQKIVLSLFVVGSLAMILFDWHASLVVFVTFVTLLYFTDFLFNLFIAYRSFAKNPEIHIPSKDTSIVPDTSWPMYTIFCPLYKEWEVVPQFIRGMEKLDYPKDKLQIIFLLEEDDAQTLATIQSHHLPPYYETRIVPHSLPKTKPKAMNYGLRFARGEYLVIYDAEDIPAPKQLKKAVLAFSRSPKNTACIQAKLSFYNPGQNVLTRLFTTEYSLWFDLILTGLQSLNAPIPLGGTSNHFRTNVLKELGGWDPFNVTEDADLGIRIARKGYLTAVMQSTTYEEANSSLSNWFKQRSRWIKGYMQTYLVHMREPFKFNNARYNRDTLFFQLTIGGKILSTLINPLLWILTICYFAFRDSTAPFIESLFSAPVFYLGVVVLSLGNFLYAFFYMMGAAKRGQWSLIPYGLLAPLYWVLISLAAYYALYELIVRPHHWNKTKHGLHLAKGISPLSAQAQ